MQKTASTSNAQIFNGCRPLTNCKKYYVLQCNLKLLGSGAGLNFFAAIVKKLKNPKALAIAVTSEIFNLIIIFIDSTKKIKHDLCWLCVIWCAGSINSFCQVHFLVI